MRISEVGIKNMYADYEPPKYGIERKGNRGSIIVEVFQKALHVSKAIHCTVEIRKRLVLANKSCNRRRRTIKQGIK